MLRKDVNDCNIAMTRAPEARMKRGGPKTTWHRATEKERIEAAWKIWERLELQLLIKILGDVPFQPFALLETKKIDNR